jgi:AcrR family transcriptional regulator
MNAPATPADTPTRILDAVTKLILDGGLPAVTLSAVCRSAGISKGGLVHHYPTKESMVDAFLQRAGNEYLQSIESAMGNRKPGSGRRAAAYVDLFLGDPTLSDSTENRDCAAVMVALIQSGGSRGDMSALFQRLLRTLRDDGLSLELAELVVTSIDGIWLQSMIEPAETLSARASRLQRRLKRLIRDEVTVKPTHPKAKPALSRKS